MKNLLRRTKLDSFLLAIWLGLAPVALAVNPPPDGGYPNQNTAEGEDAVFSLSTGTDNTAIGFNALFSNTTGSHNTGNGSGALDKNTIGTANTANGFQSLFNNISGSNNVANGALSLYSNTSGFANVANGNGALFSNTTGINNIAIGLDALYSNTTGRSNTANGYLTLFNNSTGINNTANGASALNKNTTGGNNTANGTGALEGNTTGSRNTADGQKALRNNQTGSGNIGLGFAAGSAVTTGDNNIDIGNQGVAGEANAIRIGTQGTQTATYMAGISGATVAGGVGVIVDTNGQLGTVVSSERYKEAIKPMDRASEAILALQPVSFHYKHELDPDGIPQFGLVAEEVEKVNPDLVARDEQGKPYTVRYEAVNAMLLNEFLKEHRKVEEQDGTIGQLKSVVAKQQEQITALASQIKTVSNRLELSENAPRVVASGP